MISTKRSPRRLKRILNTQMQKSPREFPRRGHIYIADLDPAFGREIHKKRPVLVISSDIFNRGTPFAVVIPISSIIPNVISPEMVEIGKIKGLDKKSIFLSLFIRSIDQERLHKKIATLPKDKLLEVEDALKLVLGMVSLD